MASTKNGAVGFRTTQQIADDMQRLARRFNDADGRPLKVSDLLRALCAGVLRLDANLLQCLEVDGVTLDQGGYDER